MFCAAEVADTGAEEVVGEVATNDWREVDRTLQALAKQRAALDVEEARWLRAAQRLQIWREIGCVSLLDYMEKRLGYGPRAAQERLRVANALEQLPALELALENGELPFTGVRELSRVMTPETEGEWLEAAQGKSVHEIEQMVAGHKKGDRPEDAPNPDLVTRVLRFEVRGPTAALERQARAALDKKHGMRLSDDEFMAALFGLALGANENAKEDTGRARFQIATTLCRQCKRGWQEGGGKLVEIGPADIERAMCDAQWIGDLDSAVPARIVQDIPRRMRAAVLQRDHHRCSVPGCRSTRNLQVHHILALMYGGTHAMSNLCTLCDAHHAAHHRGVLRISGTAPDKLVFEQLHETDVHDYEVAVASSADVPIEGLIPRLYPHRSRECRVVSIDYSRS